MRLKDINSQRDKKYKIVKTLMVVEKHTGKFVYIKKIHYEDSLMLMTNQ